MSASPDAIQLPPLPKLDPSAMIRSVVPLEGLADMEVLAPADTQYQCPDPDAPALIFVPGLGTDGYSFIRQLPLGRIGSFHAIQAPNLPAPNEEGMGHFSRYVEAYIEAKKLHERPGGVILIGTSMGGAVSLDVAIRNKVPLKGLILIGTFGCRKQIHWLPRNSAFLSKLLPAIVADKLGRLVIKFTSLFGQLQAEEVRFLAGDGIRIRSRGYLSRAAYGLTTLNLIPVARALKLPTLVFHGTHDRVLPFAAGKELADAIPGAKLVTLNDGVHACFIVKPEPINLEIAKFINQLNA